MDWKLEKKCKKNEVKRDVAVTILIGQMREQLDTLKLRDDRRVKVCRIEVAMMFRLWSRLETQ